MDKIRFNRLKKSFLISLGYVGLGTIGILSVYPDTPLYGTWVIFVVLITLPVNFVSGGVMYADSKAYGTVLIIQFIFLFLCWFVVYLILKPRRKNLSAVFDSMVFDPENPIIKLCTEGMQLEGEGKHDEAAATFRRAWEQAANDFEKFICAHYVARHQDSVANKLKWDETALQLALGLEDEGIKGALPSLYLNIAKCHEDLHDFAKAKENYQLALASTNFLNEDGYGNMIRAGINAGIERVS